MYIITPRVVCDLRSALNTSPDSLVKDIDEGHAVACTPEFEQLLRTWALQEALALRCEAITLNYKVPDENAN